jgi:hypothetical protein
MIEIRKLVNRHPVDRGHPIAVAGPRFVARTVTPRESPEVNHRSAGFAPQCGQQHLSKRRNLVFGLVAELSEFAKQAKATKGCTDGAPPAASTGPREPIGSFVF